MATSGYSGTPLLKKLGISESSKILLLHAPANYFDLLERDISKQIAKSGERIDLVHLFVTCYAQFETEMAKLAPIIKANPSIIIWVSWFKKAAGIRTDVTEDAIRNFALANNLVDVKVCAVNEIWSGLKLVVPKSKRQSKFLSSIAAIGRMLMHPKYLSIDNFTYDLPDEQIARYPLATRDSSKLLVYRDGKIEVSTYKNIDHLLPAHSLLILNNTKVIEARLLFQKPTGALIEIFCLEPSPRYHDLSTAMSQTESVEWLCLIGGASKWKPGQILQKRIRHNHADITVEARYVRKINDSFAISITWTPSRLSFAEILHFAGAIPLPPYLKRDAEISDNERYQTVYANTKGSVAAPTAGLHFTQAVLEKLKGKVEIETITLHVGAGTFKPVKSNTMEHHEMHAEFIDIDITSIEKIKHYTGKFITAVGTTSLRTIESLYWMGVKSILKKDILQDELIIQQWDPYELPAGNISSGAALDALLQWMKNNNLSRLVTKTQVLIAPGYEMKLTDALVTNFHQPGSTLLLLVAAFLGDEWRKVYDYALENDFRFLSYGDGCLLFRNSSFL